MHMLKFFGDKIRPLRPSKKILGLNPALKLVLVLLGTWDVIGCPPGNKHISVHKMMANPLTKPIPRDIFLDHIRSLGFRRL